MSSELVNVLRRVARDTTAPMVAENANEVGVCVAVNDSGPRINLPDSALTLEGDDFEWFGVQPDQVDEGDRVAINHVGPEFAVVAVESSSRRFVTDHDLRDPEQRLVSMDAIAPSMTTSASPPGTAPAGAVPVWNPETGSWESMSVAAAMAATGYAEINVTAPPAGLAPVLPDGTNQSANAIALIAYAEALPWKAVLYWPAGEYLVCGLRLAVTGIGIRGDGAFNTILKRPAGVNGDVLRVGGATFPAHTQGNDLRDFSINGNNHNNGRLLYMAYCNNATLLDLRLVNNLDTAFDTTEWWDSKVDNLTVDNCGGVTGGKPAVYLRSGATASGDGSTTDSTNVIRMYNVRIEAWRDGGLWIEPGLSGFGGNGFWFEKLKVESYNVRGEAIRIGNVRNVKVSDFYIYLGAFDGGFSTPVNAIFDIGDGTVLLDGEIGNGGVATIRAGVHSWTNARHTYERVRPVYGSAPTVAHIEHGGGYAPIIEDCLVSTAPRSDNWVTVAYMTNWRRFANSAAVEVQVRRVAGMVHLRGMVERITSAFSYAGAGPGDDSHFCTVPVGYRPARNMVYWMAGGQTGTTFTRVQLLTTGEMYTDVGGPASAGAAFGGAGSHIYLDGYSWSTD